MHTHSDEGVDVEEPVILIPEKLVMVNTRSQAKATIKRIVFPCMKMGA